MKEYRILFSAVGRRVELVKAFRQAALKLNMNVKIYGAEMTTDAPALQYCDYYRYLGKIKAPDYIPSFLKICEDDKIDLVIPTIDTDLLVLSQNREKFEALGTKVLIAAPEMIGICRDKNLTGDFFVSCGLKAPRPYNDYTKYDGSFPCFIKPKDGSCSYNAFKVEDEKQLEQLAHQVDDYIVQPFVEGREFTIDIFCDFDGNPIYITPRERLQVRAGEVLKTKIHMDETMISEMKQLCAKFKPCGPITVQLIQDKNTGENYYIEINPRFGGGAPLSMRSGARSAEAALKLLAGEKVGFQGNCCDDNTVFCRFDDCVRVKDGDSIQKIKGVIFDLDDTLYSELDYVKSGYKKIAEYLGRSEAAEKLWNYFKSGVRAIDAYLTEIGEMDKLDECVKIYGYQEPDIELYKGAEELIKTLQTKKIKVGIITDGRIEGQEAKLEALGLDKLIDSSNIIITDALGGLQFRKPNDISFRIMQNRWGLNYEEMMYVGDNTNKDFKAPVQLGMKALYFKNKEGLYYKDEASDLKTVEDFKSLSEAVLDVI